MRLVEACHVQGNSANHISTGTHVPLSRYISRCTISVVLVRGILDLLCSWTHSWRCWLWNTDNLKWFAADWISALVPWWIFQPWIFRRGTPKKNWSHPVHLQLESHPQLLLVEFRSIYEHFVTQTNQMIRAFRTWLPLVAMLQSQKAIFGLIQPIRMLVLITSIPHARGKPTPSVVAYIFLEIEIHPFYKLS